MARPQKEGLDYFPLDVDIDQDDKIALIEAQHGIEGFGVVIKLFMKIYANSYYYPWTEKEILLFKKRVNVDINLVNEIINDCARWGLFDKNLFEQYKVLTSKGIQRRYLKAAERRQSAQIEKKHLLLDEKEVNDYKNLVIVDINHSSTTHDVNIYPERIEEESKKKEKEIREATNGDKPPKDSKPSTTKTSTKSTSKPKTHYAEFVSLTNDEYTSLMARVGEEGTKRCIEILDNYKGSTGKKYKSDYRTILNWVIQRYEEERQKKGDPVDSSDKKAPVLSGFKMATSSDEIETGPYNGHDEEEPETTQGHKLTGFKMATDPEDED